MTYNLKFINNLLLISTFLNCWSIFNNEPTMKSCDFFQCRGLKLWQIVCLNNTHILICRYTRCDCNSWHSLCLKWVLSICNEELRYNNLYRGLKLLQIVSLNNTHILICRYTRCNRRLRHGLCLSEYFEYLSGFSEEDRY